MWDSLTDNWQIFLSEPAQDEQQAGVQAQQVQDEEQDQPVEEEAADYMIH